MNNFIDCVQSCRHNCAFSQVPAVAGAARNCTPCWNNCTLETGEIAQL